MAPKQKTIEETIGTKREREEGDEHPSNEHINGKESAPDGAKEETTADQAPEPKQQKLSAAPKSVLEEGRIYFYYRPRVGLTEAHNLSDVQRFFMLLSPASRKDAPHKLIAIGKKRLPDPASHERFFGFVQSVSQKMEDLTNGLGVQEYETKTQGTRRVEAARALGEGVYTIVDHGRDSQLAYELEVPTEPGEVQEEGFKIGKTGAYVISIKNPDAANPPNAGLGRSQKADFPADKKREFEGTPGGYSWISAKDTALLDYEGCELVLIAARGDISGEVKEHLDKEVGAEVEQAEHEYKGGDEDSALLEKLRAEIKAELPTGPAATGEWQ